MPTADSGCVNVGELIRNGLTLYTREAVALVYEGCSRPTLSGKQICLPLVPDDLWLAPTGEVRVEPTLPADATTDARVAAAGLLDALLPPPSDLPEYTVRASLRSLPSRLRESAAAVETVEPRDLLAILKRQLADDPHLLLQQLADRVKAPPASDQHMSREVPVSLTPSTEADPGLDRRRGPSSSQEPLARIRELDVGTPSTHEETTSVPLKIRWRMLAAALVAMLASGYGGYIYTRSLVTESPRAPAGAASASPAAREGAQETGTGGAVADATDKPRSLEGRATEAGAVGAERDGRPRPVILPFADEAFSPSFAPSGRTLFFHTGRNSGRLLEANLDDRGMAFRITLVLRNAGSRAASKDYHARPSPDGRMIAFDSERDGERGVYVASPGGAEATRVSGSGFAAVPSWSPDMKWLAFVRAEPARPKVWNLWLRDLVSGTFTRQTSFRVGQLWGASWFPDSRRLCYSHESELTIHDLSTGKKETFHTPRRGQLIRTPAVSPDGGRIVFQVHRDGVWMLNLQTRTMARILSDATAEEFAWDPEGRTIVYHSRRDGGWRIWMTTPPPS